MVNVGESGTISKYNKRETMLYFTGLLKLCWWCCWQNIEYIIQNIVIVQFFKFLRSLFYGFFCFWNIWVNFGLEIIVMCELRLTSIRLHDLLISYSAPLVLDSSALGLICTFDQRSPERHALFVIYSWVMMTTIIMIIWIVVSWLLDHVDVSCRSVAGE